jgi:hypothetical protein
MRLVATPSAKQKWLYLYSYNRVTMMLQLTHGGLEITPGAAPPLPAGVSIKPADHNCQIRSNLTDLG